MKTLGDVFTMFAAAGLCGRRYNCRRMERCTNVLHAVSIWNRKIFGSRDRKGRCDEMAGSSGRKTVAVMRGLMMLCDSCYDQVMAEHLTDHKNFVQNYEALFDTICPGCTDINRPLVDDMLGSTE